MQEYIYCKYKEEETGQGIFAFFLLPPAAAICLYCSFSSFCKSMKAEKALNLDLNEYISPSFFPTCGYLANTTNMGTVPTACMAGTNAI